MIALRSKGCLRTYASQAADFQRPAAWITSGVAPSSASAVAPPARIECPDMVNLDGTIWDKYGNAFDGFGQRRLRFGLIG